MSDTDDGNGAVESHSESADAVERAPGGTNPEHAGRVTSPMQPYSGGAVTTGAVVLLVGLALTFGVAFVV